MSAQSYPEHDPNENAYDKANRLAREWNNVIEEFLKGDVRGLLGFVEETEGIKKVSTRAIEMLRTALEKQRDDAMAYRLLLRFAHDAGVPLISAAGLEAMKRIAEQ